MHNIFSMRFYIENAICIFSNSIYLFYIENAICPLNLFPPTLALARPFPSCSLISILTRRIIDVLSQNKGSCSLANRKTDKILQIQILQIFYIFCKTSPRITILRVRVVKTHWKNLNTILNGVCVTIELGPDSFFTPN